MVAQAKRGRIRCAARFGDQLRLERRPGRRHARGLAGRGREIGGEDDLDLGIAGDRARGAGEGAAEQVDALGHGGLSRPSPTTLSGRSSPNTRW